MELLLAGHAAEGREVRTAHVAKLRRRVGAVLSLSLAMGACIAAFALIDALILWPLPVEGFVTDWCS